MSTLINNTSASTTAPSLSVAVFPYQWIADLRKLDAPRLPPRNAFHSGLTGHTTTQGEYEDCQRAWQDKRMTSFREWLIPYNNMDTIPFSKALEPPPPPHFVGRWVGGDWGGGDETWTYFLWSQLAWLDRSLSTQHHPRGHLLHSFQ